MKIKFLFTAAAVFLLAAVSSPAAEWGLKEGSVELKSASNLAFGPDGILFVGDAKAATIYAIETGDANGEPVKAKHSVKGLNSKVGELLGASADEVNINDLAVNPATGNIFLAVSKGDSTCLIQVAIGGKLSKLSLEKIKTSKAVLADAPEDKVAGQGRRRRQQS